MKMNITKKLQLAILSAAMILITASCKQGSVTRITTDDNGSKKSIEYSGQIVFNKERTAIDYISDGGYLKFEREGQKIEAESKRKGKIKYKYNGDETTMLSKEGRLFLSEAVKEITRAQEKLRAGEKY
jgi:hypothetical protein